jgi:HEAT repeat protein
MKLRARILLHAVLLLALVAQTLTAKLAGYGQVTQGESRDEEIAQLIAIIRNSQLRIEDPEKVVEAINKLGEMKAASAVDDLAQLLTFRLVSRGERLTGMRSEADARFPAVNALYLIGKPALPALVKVIENFDEQDLMSRNALNTMLSIFREKLSEGVEYVNQAASRSSSALGSQRLEKLAREMNRIIRENQK